MSEPACPLCQRTKPMRKAKPLYGEPVCKKCYYSFANRRQLAYILDAIFWSPIAWVLGAALGAGLIAVELSETGIVIASFVAGWIVIPMIFLFKDGFTGHSPGKLICGVQVVDPQSHEPIGFGKAWRRNLPLLIPFVPLIVAFQLVRGYRWGDRFGATKVIWKKYRQHRVFTGQLACDRCQYDLRGNTSGVCPECGTPIPMTQQDQLTGVSLTPAP